MSAGHKYLVLQHETVEHPGIFRQFLAEDGISYDAVELQRGAALPALGGYDALWVMGGPQDVWQTDEFPWLTDEIAFIRHAVVEAQMPFLGLCLGHQLLAEALGGRTGPAQTPEIGVMDVTQAKNASAARAFAGIAPSFPTLQWHGAEVTQVPDGAQVLARSPACAVQALSYKSHALTMQFHLETESDTVANWAKIPAYAKALEAALGAGAVPALEREVAAQMGVFNATARQFYNNWKAFALESAAA